MVPAIVACVVCAGGRSDHRRLLDFLLDGLAGWPEDLYHLLRAADAAGLVVYEEESGRVWSVRR